MIAICPQNNLSRAAHDVLEALDAFFEALLQ
jgi:hypothetical protein